MSTASNGRFLVQGGSPIHGEIEPQGNKNEAMPLMAAACLTDQPVILQNIPQIDDVKLMETILNELGLATSETKTKASRTVILQTKSPPKNSIPLELGSRLRGSVTLAGPLLARTGSVTLPRPGGDRIGRRRLDTHLQIFSALGNEITDTRDGIKIQAKKLKGADILLDESSVTATENGLCAAAPVLRQIWGLIIDGAITDIWIPLQHSTGQIEHGLRCNCLEALVVRTV
jgi:UDP-N-acetylglucosamine 1-carboxyvinyltransferase